MISICIPAYTYLDYADEAVHRILGQDEDFELVVVEDFDQVSKSVSNTEKIESLRDKLNSDSRVVWHRNLQVLKIQQNWNFTISLANRPYIKMMGADDLISKGGVRKLLNIIQDSPDVDFHGHLANIINAEGEVIRSQRPYAKNSHYLDLTPDLALSYKLMQVARFKEPVCNIFLKENWAKVGGYSEKYRFCFDIDFNVKMMSMGRSRLWNEYIVELRRHSNSDGAKLSADLALSELRLLISDIYAKKGSNFNSKDKSYGEAWLAYRLIELAIARYRLNPVELVTYIKNNFSHIEFSVGTICILIRMLIRRAYYRDIQLTI